MSNKKFKFKAVPTGGSAPTPGSTGNDTYTLFAKQLSATTFTPIVTDGNGKALEMVTSSGGGGGSPATPQTLSEVLTAGNKLEGKEIEGDLVVRNSYTSGGSATGGYSIVGNEEGIDLSTSGSDYSSRTVIGGREKLLSSTFNYPSDSSTGMGGYFYIGNKDINLLSEVIDHSESLQFNSDNRGLFFNYYGDNKLTKGFSVLDSGMQVTIPDTKLGGENTTSLSFNSNNGLSAGEYFNPTSNNQYVQKKYVDDKIATIGSGGGSGATAQNIQKTIETGNT